MEQKRRGNKDTQTSDAKFDEQFKLGHQMAAKVCRRSMYNLDALITLLKFAWMKRFSCNIVRLALKDCREMA